jgi:ChpA-C
MDYSTKRRVVLGMTTGGLLVSGLGMSSAQADTAATGSAVRSPGFGSGNLIQLPVDVPINVCGNQVDVIGLLDSMTGNSCDNHTANTGATTASGSAKGSPGIGSGNLIEVPVNAPVNVCGNQVDIVGLGNSVHGNSCANRGGGGRTTASSSSKGSPGIGSGNVIQVPISAPVNVCGNQVDIVGLLNAVAHDSCKNGGTPPRPVPPPTTPPTRPPAPVPFPTQTPPTIQPPPPVTPPGSCPCPTPPPLGTPCPPSGTTTGTAAATGPSRHHSGPGSTGCGSNGGGSNPGGGSHSGGSSGVLAHTGTGALTVAPLGASLLGGGFLLRRRFARRAH